MRTAAPNDVYTQQGAKPACQEDTNAKFSHLLLAQLPRTQFTHSKLPNPRARKTPMQKFRTSYWHSYPEHSLRMPGRPQRKIFAPPIDTAPPNTVYTQQGAKPACQEDITAICSHLLLAGLPPHSKVIYTQQAAKPFLEAPNIMRLPHRQQPRPTATRRAATLSGGSKYCACHANRNAAHGDQARQNPFWSTQTGAAAHGDQARRNPFWRLQVLRLPRKQEPRPTATRRARTLSGGSKYCACHADRSRGPRRQGAPQPFLEAPKVLSLPRKQEPRPTATRRAATLSGGSKYCACHANRSRGAPQPFMEAPSIAPATQTGAAAHGDQARRNPFCRLQVLRLPRKQEPRPTATRRARTKYCACHANRSRGPRRPGAPEPFLEVLRLPRKQSRGPRDQARRNPFWRLQVLRLPRRQEPRPTATRRARTLSGGSKYCACHANRAAAHGDQARRNPF